MAFWKTGAVDTGNNVEAEWPAGVSAAARCPRHSPSEQHMLTMISKDICWAVSKAVASLSSSLPLWTKKHTQTHRLWVKSRAKRWLSALLSARLTTEAQIHG